MIDVVCTQYTGEQYSYQQNGLEARFWRSSRPDHQGGSRADAKRSNPRSKEAFITSFIRLSTEGATTGACKRAYDTRLDQCRFSSCLTVTMRPPESADQIVQS